MFRALAVPSPFVSAIFLPCKLRRSAKLFLQDPQPGRRKISPSISNRTSSKISSNTKTRGQILATNFSPEQLDNLLSPIALIRPPSCAGICRRHVSGPDRGSRAFCSRQRTEWRG